MAARGGHPKAIAAKSNCISLTDRNSYGGFDASQSSIIMICQSATHIEWPRTDLRIRNAGDRSLDSVHCFQFRFHYRDSFGQALETLTLSILTSSVDAGFKKVGAKSTNDAIRVYTSPVRCYKKSRTTRRSRYQKPLQAASIVVAIPALILLTSFPVTSSSATLHETASAASPTGSMQQPQNPSACGHAKSIWCHSAATQGRAVPTVALRAAIWTAIAVLSVAVAVAADQALRCLRPARTRSIRWEAGWAGQAGGGRAAAGR